MDLLTHIVAGLAAGTVVAGFSKKKGMAAHAAIVAAAGAGGALPDLDAISLWSKFDATIGKLLHLDHSGAVIYAGKFWYSHHGFLHSIAAALLIACGIAAIGFLPRARARGVGFRRYLGRLTPVSAGFAAGFVIHLLGDMPTPASDWGGVRLLWPLKTYVGGTGEIWWWNNYDLFLIACGTFAVGAALLILGRSARFRAPYAIAAAFALAGALSLVQIHSREVDYAYTGNTNRYRQFEEASKRQQREILGERLYTAMEWFDRKLPILF
jgi:membrane-bound metal-dependent hydrolase YbcI (DUF457 family)